jgi:hypothetical protein
MINSKDLGVCSGCVMYIACLHDLEVLRKVTEIFKITRIGFEGLTTVVLRVPSSGI